MQHKYQQPHPAGTRVRTLRQHFDETIAIYTKMLSFYATYALLSHVFAHSASTLTRLYRHLYKMLSF